MLLWELRKIYRSRSGLVGLGIFIFLILAMSFMNPERSYRLSQGLGEDLSWEEDFRSRLGELEEARSLDSSDEFSRKIESLSREKLAKLKTREYEDIDFWRTFNYRASHPLVIAVIVILIGLFTANIYTEEQVSRVDSLILSSKKRPQVLGSKLLVGVGLPLFSYYLYLLIEFLWTYIEMGGPKNSQLSAIRLAENPLLLSRAYTIGEYIGYKILLLSLILISLSILASLISFLSKGSGQSIGGFIGIVFIGKLLTLAKFLPDILIYILSKINYIDIGLFFNKMALNYQGSLSLFSRQLDIFQIILVSLIIRIVLGLILVNFSFKNLIKG